VLHRRRLQPRLEALLGAGAELGAVLSINDAARAHGACHEFRAVAAARAHIEDLHAHAYPGEGQELDRIAALIGLAVRVAAIGRRDQGVVIEHALPPNASWSYREQAD